MEGDMANGAKNLSEMTTAELLAYMDDAARRVRENAAACSVSAAEAVAHADRASSEVAGGGCVAEVAGIGDGRDVVTVAPQASPAREVELATVAALGVGLDPQRAVLDARLAIVDRLLAQARSCAA